jgi:2-polyprenyl-3-methyl-5-hydroxy-6-metoxy-1,4-benzoquinol methylase
MTPDADMSSTFAVEHVPCDLCGVDQAEHVAELHDYWHGEAGTFTVVRCRQCSLHYLNPRPTEAGMARFYPGDYYAYAARPAAVTTTRSRIKRRIRASRWLSAFASTVPAFRDAARDAQIRDDIPEWIPPGAVLDLGCGSGLALDLLKDMGWRTTGLEPHPQAADVARRSGHEVFCQSATAPLPPGRTFDLIIVSHVLEHVHSPTRMLTQVRPLLTPGTGRMVIEVPNLESLFTPLFQGLATAFDSPRHLYMFSPITLEQLLTRAGFDIVLLRHRSGPAQMIKSLTLVSRLFALDGHAAGVAEHLASPEVIAAFQPIADLATARQRGGALRVVVSRGA